MATQYGEGGSISVMMEGPFGGGGSSVKLAEVVLPVSEWKGAESPYSQAVTVDGLSQNSMVNLQLSVEQLAQFHNKDITFTAVNENGTVTIYAIGDKPDGDYTIQATLFEVIGNSATIIGSTVGTTMLTVPGSVQACIVFNNAALDQLTTFPFTVAVAENPVIGAEPSDDYIRLQWLEDKLDEYLRKAADSRAFEGKPGHTPEYGVDYGTPEQIADIANQAAGILADDIKKISDGKVDKAEGMGLSSNDYDNAAKAKVDAIPEYPKYTDTVYDDTEVVTSLSQIKDDLVKQSLFEKKTNSALETYKENVNYTLLNDYIDTQNGSIYSNSNGRHAEFDITEDMVAYNGPQEIDHLFQMNREHGKINQRKRKETILCHEGNTHRNLRPRSFWRYSRESGSWEPLLRRTT